MAVPMAAVVQYKGFRAFVNIGLNFKDYEVAFGLNAGRFVADFDLMKGMNQIGKKLNIMPHTHKSRTSSGAMIEVPLSQGIKVYKTQKKNQEDLYKDQDQSMKEQYVKLSQNLEVSDYQSKKKANNEHIYYITNAMSIFPIDIDISKRTKYPTRRRLRPEFMRAFERKLNPDTFEVSIGGKKSDPLESDMTEANKNLKSKNVSELVNKLDRMEYLPLDSYGFTKIFHEFGVNMRYLGLITESSKLPHIQEICMTEMVARSCKKILNYKLSRMIFMAGESVKDIDEGIDLMNEAEIIEAKQMFDNELKKLVADMLNFVFGNSELSKDFWKVNLREQMSYDFGYRMNSNTDIKDFPIGALLNCISYHFNIKLQDKNFEGLIEKQFPFNQDSIVCFNHKTKSYSFKKHKLRRVSEYYIEHRENKQYALALQLLRMKLTSEDALGRKEEYLELLGEIADLKLEMGQIDEAIKAADKAISILDTFAPQCIKFICIRLKGYIKKEMDTKVFETFEAAKKVIEYNFGIYHPLHATFHEFIGYYYFMKEDYEQSLECYEAGLNDCLRILGVDHPLTGQIYLDIASVFLKMDKRERAIIFLKKAYEIYNTTKYEESDEKASLANKIAVILFGFGLYNESMKFAQKSNSIYLMKNELNYTEKIMDNNLVEARCLEEMNSNDSSLSQCEASFLMLTRKNIWKPTLGRYLVEIIKVTFKTLVKVQDHLKKCNIYYVLDLIHVSFQSNEAVSIFLLKI